jgi:hypothetical protein
MCVLPAKSVGDALPPVLANLIVLAENMDEDETSSSSKARSARQRQQQQQQRGQLRGSKAARKAARKQRQAAAAEKIQGLSGLDVLAALGEGDEAELLGSGDEADPTAAAAAGWGDDDDNDLQTVGVDDNEGAEQQQKADAWGLVSSTAAAADGAAATAAAEYSLLLGFELSGDAGSDQLQLAEELAATFPSNVESLVDLTGKYLQHDRFADTPWSGVLAQSSVCSEQRCCLCTRYCERFLSVSGEAVCGWLRSWQLRFLAMLNHWWT